MSVKKLSKNIIIYGLSNGLKSLVPFIMMPILTTYISAEGYGLLSIIETSLLFITPFIILNLEGFVSVQFFKSSKEELKNYIGNGIFLSLASFVVTFILFYLFKDFLSSALEISPNLLLLLPVFVVLKLVPTIVLVLYQAQQKAISYFAFSITQTLVDFGLSTLFIMLLLRGYEGRLEGIYLAFFIFNIIGAFLLYRMGYLSFSLSKEKMKSILDFGTPLIPHAIGGTIIALSDRYFVTYFEGYAQTGFYTAAYQIGAIMLLFSRSVNQAWTPMLYDLIKKKSFDQIAKFTATLFLTFALVGLATYLLSDTLFEYMVDPSYYNAKEYFPLLLLGFVLQSFYFLYSGFIFYAKRTKLLASITFTGAIVNLSLNYILIQNMGVIGVAYATVITWGVFLIATFIAYQFSIKKSLMES